MVNDAPASADSPHYQGDQKRQLVEKLFNAHWNDLVNWLTRQYGAGPPEPEDIAQAAFEKMATLDNLDRIHDHRAYLYTIAARQALMGIRWLARTRAFIDTELAEVATATEEITPERIYMVEERFQQLEQALEGLSPKQREIVIRCRIHGQTYEQISAETGWSIGSISNNVQAAMLTLRNAEGGEEGAEQNE